MIENNTCRLQESRGRLQESRGGCESSERGGCAHSVVCQHQRSYTMTNGIGVLGIPRKVLEH